MTAAQQVADTWLYQTLTAALDVPVASHPAPDDTAVPHVTFSVLSAQDNLTGPGFRFLTRYRYLVRAIARGRSYPYDLADQLDEALTRKTGAAAGGTVLASVRVAPFQLSETADGVEYRHAGGEYQVLIHTP